jgi:hypothetical protein
MKKAKIDNFDFINPLLKFDSAEDFYYLEVIKRRKDNPDLERSEITLKSYFLYEGELMKFKGSIEDLCKVNNARAYIRLNRRNIKDVAFKMNEKVAKYLMNREYKGCASAFEKACGDGHSEYDKKWLIDFDTKDTTLIGKYMVIIGNVYGVDSDETFYHIPTINGRHVICRPFNTELFRKECMVHGLEVLDIHKDNPTLLYFDGETNDTESKEIPEL